MDVKGCYSEWRPNDQPQESMLLACCLLMILDKKVDGLD